VPVSNVERLQVWLTARWIWPLLRSALHPDRARQVEFTSAYYQDGPSLVVARSHNWESWSDLRGGRVAVLRGSSAIPLLNRYLPGVELVPVDSYQEGAELLLKGSVQAWAADRSVLARVASREHPQFQFLGSPLAAVGLGIAMPKGLEHAELRLRVRRELENLRAEGWLAERARAWGLP
jgi:polar amino acid transport system substrate-binding protein